MKPFAKGTTLLFLSLTFLAFLFVRRVEACYQIAVPSVRIRSRSLAGTVSLNGNPIGGAMLSLHRFLGPYSVEADHAESHAVSKSIAAKNGKFSFGEVPTGKYVIIMHSPSSESTAVELVRPKADESDTIAIEFFADFCQRAAAISAQGERLSPSTPTIFGRSAY
jgi:hypothetical protein